MAFLKINLRNPAQMVQTASILLHAEGTAAIEFALVAPIMLLLIFGIIEFSLIMAVTSVTGRSPELRNELLKSSEHA